MGNQASEDKIRAVVSETLANIMIKSSLQKLDKHTDPITSGRKYIAMHNEELNTILELIRTEKLKLLDRLSSHQEDLFWWTGGEYEKTKAVDMRAIAAERELLTKLEAEL